MLDGSGIQAGTGPNRAVVEKVSADISGPAAAVFRRSWRFQRTFSVIITSFHKKFNRKTVPFKI